LIAITYNKNSVSIKGHAGYAPIGQDIVCAGISTLVQTLIQSVEDLCTDEISYHLQPGSVEIKHGNLTKDAQLLLDSFFIGCYMIADRYPKHVQVTRHGSK
jgi:uncharacterized protein YsxB (DUF464 family)